MDISVCRAVLMTSLKTSGHMSVHYDVEKGKPLLMKHPAWWKLPVNWGKPEPSILANLVSICCPERSIRAY